MMRCISNVVQIKLPPMDKSTGGIVIPEMYKKKNKYMEGTVVAIGPGKISKRGKLMPVEVKVGDTVMIHPHKCLTCELDGEMYAFTREPEIMCITDKIHFNEFEKLWANEGDLFAKKDL